MTSPSDSIPVQKLWGFRSTTTFAGKQSFDFQKGNGRRPGEAHSFFEIGRAHV